MSENKSTTIFPAIFSQFKVVKKNALFICGRYTLLVVACKTRKIERVEESAILWYQQIVLNV
jgi:hypothetical protein